MLDIIKEIPFNTITQSVNESSQLLSVIDHVIQSINSYLNSTLQSFLQLKDMCTNSKLDNANLEADIYLDDNSKEIAEARLIMTINNNQTQPE